MDVIPRQSKCVWCHLPDLVNVNKKLWKITIFDGKTMGKPWENGDLDGTLPFLMGTLTISMAIFNSYVTALTGSFP